MNEKIAEKLKTLPNKPGVYIMHDAAGTIIYVGKAKILKNRVRQYFHTPYNHSPKVQAMVAKIDDFEYIICDSELEALVLECNLIKQHKPHYNIMLRDDKHYPYVKLTVNEEYPRMLYVRRIERDGARYFGPYPSGFSVRETLELLKKIFKIQHCGKSFPRDIGKARPCLYHSMGQCLAPCSGNVDKKEYRAQFDDIARFLDGKTAELVADLEARMYEASDSQNYEMAADIRDKLISVKKLGERQKVISAKGEDVDVFAVAAEDDMIFVEGFYVRGGKMLGRDSFDISSQAAQSESEALSAFLSQYYSDAVYIPKMVLLSEDIDDADTLSEFLREKRGTKVEVRTPQRGEYKKLAEMAKKNAKNAIALAKTEQMKKTITKNSLIELAKLIGSDVIPDRIESFDISNTSGEENVASMVVFLGGEAAKKEYRRFRLEYKGANDVACMKEALHRRFTHEAREGDGKFAELPDLLLIDGGKTQLAAANEVLSELEIDIPAFGMVKDDRHRTRALMSEDGEIAISPMKSVFHLITRIQDETHRFAITYHRLLRGKKSIHSELDDIDGVGKKRRELLLKHFNSVAKIKAASENEIAAVKGIGKNAAQKIYDHFHGEKANKQ